MKTRMGFVSNSSSSSFCILGISMSEDTLCKLESKKDSEKWKNIDVEYGVSEECKGMCYIGKYPFHMKNEETLGEFKDSIVEKLKNVGIDVKREDINWHEDGGYNG